MTKKTTKTTTKKKKTRRAWTAAERAAFAEKMKAAREAAREAAGAKKKPKDGKSQRNPPRAAPTIALPENVRLPNGFIWGDHWTDGRREWFEIRRLDRATWPDGTWRPDGTSIVAELRGDMSYAHGHVEPGDLDAGEMTPDMVRGALIEAFDRIDGTAPRPKKNAPTKRPAKKRPPTARKNAPGSASDMIAKMARDEKEEPEVRANAQRLAELIDTSPSLRHAIDQDSPTHWRNKIRALSMKTPAEALRERQAARSAKKVTRNPPKQKPEDAARTVELWHLPPENAGQMIEVAYGTNADGKMLVRSYNRSARTYAFAFFTPSARSPYPWNATPTGRRGRWSKPIKQQ